VANIPSLIIIVVFSCRKSNGECQSPPDKTESNEIELMILDIQTPKKTHCRCSPS